MADPQTPPDLIGQSKVFLDALDHASRVAMIDRPALVLGERGAGKALIAARIHFLSPRWDGPLVRVNCAAMAEGQLEAELFGLAGGSRRPGRLERAEGGTLFLEDIAAAPVAVQEKLLRVIEDGEYERPAGEEPRKADVRIIASATDDLRRLAHEGKMRAEFLDRLASELVFAPPLRDRPDDIALLAAHFGARAAAELGLKFPGFAPEAMVALNAHDWPGNVRELKTVVERAAFHWGEGAAEGAISQIVIDPFEGFYGKFDASKAAPKKQLTGAPVSFTHPETPHDAYDLRAYMSKLEKAIVEDALAKNGGSQKRAAEALSLTYDQIRGIIKKHEIAA
ncbi:sigma 54-interacting transcriptional regulator [Hyphococcus luteus]|uniref:Sigma-54 factor interaction domain-containing protein n=1 Tax=Hyphococcus luteus TaxID=2058213 RepID=A0A2S7K319_9PROT|nr:sigma 54-interacting transcriptional regulator [Marinicaulis flavus]PQA86887.1 hypothetical protein CW354_15555 [Marinicaulis flavus]